MSRTVAQDAASKTGIDASLLEKMLPMLAMLVAGYMAKQQGAGAAARVPSGGGGLGGVLAGLLRGRGVGGAAAQGGGLASMLDLGSDGNPLDDILEMAGKAGH